MTVSRTVEICNRRGLHARASNAFSRLSLDYESTVTVERDGMTADARSIMELLSLAASQGCLIEITADGPDEDAAIAALSALVANRFGEED